MVGSAISIPLVAICTPIFRRACPQSKEEDEIEPDDHKISMAL